MGNRSNWHSACAVLDKIALSEDLHLVTPAELRAFCDWLEKRRDYQIFVGRRECDNGDQVEIFVTYGEIVGSMQDNKIA